VDGYCSDHSLRIFRLLLRAKKNGHAYLNTIQHGEKGIRTLGTEKTVQRISNPPLSTTQPSLLLISSLQKLLFFVPLCASVFFLPADI
jgi:hypothetical protein